MSEVSWNARIDACSAALERIEGRMDAVSARMNTAENARWDAEFNEADHPRDENGKFGSGGGSSSSRSEDKGPVTVGNTGVGSRIPFVQEFVKNYTSGHEKSERLKQTPDATLKRAHELMKGHIDPSTNDVRQHIEVEAKRRGLDL